MSIVCSVTVCSRRSCDPGFGAYYAAFQTPVMNWEVINFFQLATGEFMQLGHLGVTDWNSR